MALIKGGCPVCGGDVKGDPDAKYYCPHCNLMISQSSLKKQ